MVKTVLFVWILSVARSAGASFPSELQQYATADRPTLGYVGEYYCVAVDQKPVNCLSIKGWYRDSKMQNYFNTRSKLYMGVALFQLMYLPANTWIINY